MDSGSTLERAYERYLLATDKTLWLDGRLYYKIISKTKTNCLGKEMVAVTLPVDLFRDRKVNSIIDENGNLFTLSFGPQHCSFHSTIPEWYLKSLTFYVESETACSEIGDYAAPNQ